MSSVTRISRRRFLALTGLSTGGLVLMGTVPGVSHAAVLDEAQGGSLNLFVSIRETGEVEIIAHRSEMGTGIRTSLPQVVADEMEADWGQVTVIQGLANAEYGSQNTDGSRSVRDFYHVMRRMGAAARYLLEQAAAEHWNVSMRDVHAKLHRVHHSDGRSIGFGELAVAAAQLPAPDFDALPMKSPDEFRYIGKDVPIVDLEDICSGKAIFGIDVRIPGMLFASIERTPVMQGKARKYDTEKVRSLPGVIDVVKIDGTPLPSVFHALEGVAVIARDTHTALKAREQLAVEWDTGEHGNYGSTAQQDQLMRTVAKEAGKVQRERGDTDKALASADRIVEASYRTPYLAHAPMEPPMATAHLYDDICEIWACTQTPQKTQEAVAEALGLKKEQVVVHVTLLGGGFGRKSKPDFSVEAALLARHSGKPVQVVWSREDDIRHTYFHSQSAQYYRAALDNSGNVTAWLAREATPPISSTFAWPETIQSAGSLGQTYGSIPFDVPNLRLESHPAQVHTRIGWLRSVFNIPYGFGVGTFVDELAHAAGKEPVEFWLQLIGEDRLLDFQGEGFKFSNYGRSLKDYPYDTARLKNVINLLAESIPWNEKLPEGQGWGMSAARSFLCYVAVASKVEVVDGKLSVTEMHCVADAGTVVNPDRVRAQLEGAMIFGLSLALMGEISFADGTPEQSNFHDYPVARINQSPGVIRTHIVRSDALPAGVGEPGVPPVAPSIGNAIFAATGKRLRELPFNKEFSV